MALRWEKCRGNRWAGYDEDDFVALLKPIVFERDGRDSLTGARVYEDAWTWELFWSKNLKGWVVKRPFGNCATLADGVDAALPAGKLKPLSKIAQRAKGQKDLRKLEELPAGTIITDSDGDTWVKRAGLPFSYDNWLTFDQTERLQFHKHFIEVPRSSLGAS